MHFFVFTFLLLVTGLIIGLLASLSSYLLTNIRKKEWSWVGLFSILYLMNLLCLYETVGLMYKFINT